MQDPKNRDKVMVMVAKMKRGIKRARHLGTIKKRSKAEKVVVREIKKRKPRVKQDEDTSILLNGWRIVLGPNSIKIEQSHE
jgi:hypothetical protein